MRIVVASLVAGLLGGAIGAGIGAVVIRNHDADDLTALRSDVAALRSELSAMRAQVVQPGPPPAAAPARARIRISSNPTGAEVSDGDRLLGTTPLEVSMSWSRTHHSFTLRLAGYRNESLEIMPDHDTTYEATLEKGTAAEPAVRKNVDADCDVFSHPHGCGP
jgi:hypothetical protein